jgi:hypothetical protein
MFGERYFSSRDRLAGVMRGIVSLGEETHTDLSEHLPFDELREGLGKPFLFVVCGEVNSGRSSLLNGLFGRDICKISPVPETHRVTWHRHGPFAKTSEINAVFEERRRPIDVLRNFHLIDTPGTNSIVKGHEQFTRPFIDEADLILIVFPISNPWGSATWDFISRLPEAVFPRVVFILQQVDQRDPVDTPVILGHIRDLSMKRLGRVPPIFPVSAKQAIEAKKSLSPDATKLDRSGFAALEAHISREICHSRGRRQSLETWRAQSAYALRLIEDRIEDQSRNLNIQGRFLEEIEREIDRMREQFVIRLPRHLSEVAEVFQTEAVVVSKQLRRHLGAIRSIFRLFVGDRTGQKMEALFVERLQAAVEAVAKTDSAEVAEVCRTHWSNLDERVQQNLGIDLGKVDSIDESLFTAQRRFIQQLGRAARQGISNLKVRHQLDKELRRRNLALKSFTFTTLFLLTAGAICGICSVPWLPAILCSASAAFFCGGVAIALITRKTLVAEFQERLLDTCGLFASTLRADYEEALRIVFQDYTDTLGAVRKHLAKEKSAVEPRLQRWKELFLTLKAIEQEL